MIRSCMFAFASLTLAAGCGGGSGTWEVRVYGESFIEDGIPADETVDGWSITFDTFEVRVLDVVGTGSDGAELTAGSEATYDLSEASDGDGQLVGSTDAAQGTVESVDWRIAPDGDDDCGVKVVGSANDGTVTKFFDWCFSSDVTYVGCETSATIAGDAPGLSQLTVHGDHLFFDDLVSDEPNVAFDLLAAADDAGNADGYVDRSELEATDITGEDRYQVGSADIDDLWGFVAAQAEMVGHIDGEGHCDTQ